MIDTDKYEGHTPIWNLWGETGAWWVQSDFTTHDDFVVAEVRSQNEVDARLIADAPLILADYKRLQKIIGKFDEFMCGNWTRENLHRTFTGTKGLWNELLTREEEE
tara:strand:+ start:3368 stop:3685 length:318 start_codon:yes stop_codon:yes gene_type:complete